MADPEAVARLSAALVARAGGYLRNTVRQELITCAVCATPVTGFRLCYQCQRRRGRAGLADATGFLAYAVAGRQSGYVMQGYKARPPVAEHRTIVSLLVLLGLARHGECAGTSVPLTHWATVPSLPAQPGEHPLHAIVTRLAPGHEVVLTAAEDVEYARDLDPRHFRAAAPLPAGAHVLLVDDTWARGGHAQSAVLALRTAGAARVSVLVAARWINEAFGANAAFLNGLADRDYDPAICPWTGDGCAASPEPAREVSSSSRVAVVERGNLPGLQRAQAGVDPAAHDRLDALCDLTLRDKGETVQFLLGDPDTCPLLHGEHATVVDDHHALGIIRLRRHPVHRQYPSQRAVEPDLFGHLTAARGVRRLLGFHDAARHIPGIPVNRVNEQDLAFLVTAQGAGRHPLAGQGSCIKVARNYS